MRFLRSVIADARPRKHTLESSDGPATMIGLNARGLEGDASGAEQKSPSTPDQASRLNTSLSIREVSSDFKVSDAPALVQSDNPVKQDIQDTRFNIEPESPISVPADEPGPTPDEEIRTPMDTVNLPDRESGSEEDKASKAEGSMASQPAGTVIPDSRMNSPKGREHDPSIVSPQTHGAENRESGHEEREPVSSSAFIRDSPGKELTDNDGNSVHQAQEGAGQHEAEKALADGGKAHQVSPGVYKQADMRSPPNQEGISRPQTLDESKGARGDVQPVFRQVVAMASQGSSATEHASVPQSVDKKVSTSVSSSDPAPTKPGSPEPHIARPARTSANPEALRSVPAMPLQTDSMSKAGDTVHSRPPFRSAGITHEAPKVQIGQIDVIIEAAAQPATKPAPSSSPSDLASRYYLRRL